jgi:hypothetical protein
MFRLRHLGTIALLTALVTLAAAAANGGTNAATHPLVVTSSLDGKRVLPQVTRWLAHPNVAPAQVTRVDFLIDGKLRWIEQLAPYNYGSDDEKGHLTTIVRATHGRTATDVVSARVVPSPTPPAALAGTWTRQLTPQDAAKADPKYGTDNVPPTGKWRLIIDRVGIWELDPLGTGIVQGYSISGATLHTLAPITMVPRKPNHDPGQISRFGAHIDAGGGIDCDESGPFGTYHWSVTGNELALSVVNEPCGQRRAVYEGTWTRLS